MSLPRVLSLSEEELVCAPLPGTEMLRVADEALDKAGQFSRKVSGAHMEIMVRVREHTEPWSGIHLITGKASVELIRIGYDCARHEVVVDCQKAGGLFSSLPLEKPLPGELRLHIFVDGSVLEVFVNDRQAISARFYIQEPQALSAQLQGEAQANLWIIREIRSFP
jgi:beta-fructofuranosidase